MIFSSGKYLIMVLAALWPLVDQVAAAAVPPSPVAQKLGMKLVFDDDFHTFRQYLGKDGEDTCDPPGAGIWETSYIKCNRVHEYRGKSQALVTMPREQEIYMDPKYHGEPGYPFPKSLVVNPFVYENGVFAIEAKPTDPQLLPYVKKPYTSGMITSIYSFSQTYGYFEARMKLPKGKGLWPAFWLLSADKVRPPEIDILEAFGAPNDKGIGAPTNIHFHSDAKPGSDSLANWKPGEYRCSDWYNVGVDVTDGFHTYGADVEADGITFYFDDKPYHECPPNPTIHGPLYMIINLAIGGGWANYPDTNNVWPARMYIEYVRAYSR